MATSGKTIAVFVNAGEKAITFARRDGQPWELPFFVNAPNGVREHLISNVLVKGADGKATRTVTFELPVRAMERVVIKQGDNAGKSCMRFVITKENLADWLSSLDVRDRGAVDNDIVSILAKDAQTRNVSTNQTNGEIPF